ncbi:MAG TPA: MFS transporter [Kofleriaceae bacterium]|jgi:MFS family permease|nr:MFS transporter [Kofleriaceae bacterium]
MQRDNRHPRAALAMFVVLLLSYVINAMDRQIFSVLAADVRQALSIDLPRIGLAATIFTLGMGLAGLPTGYLLAKMSRRNVTVIGLAVFSVATYLTASSQGLGDLLIYRFLSGLGEAMQLTALLAIGTTYFYRHRAVAASALNFTFGIGAILGPNIGAAILHHHDWKAPFMAFGIAGLPALILIVLFVRSWFTEAAPATGAQPAAAAARSDRDEANAASSLTARKPLLLALATVFTGLAIYGYLGLYPTYLREGLHFTPQQAGLCVSFYGLGALLSLIGGWLGDKYNYRKLLFISLIISAISGGLAFTPLGSDVSLHAVVSFVFGAAISGMGYANLSAGLIKSIIRAKASQASGLFVASLYIPAAFAGYLLGRMKGPLGWTTAGILQLAGSAVVAAILVVASGSRSAAKLS